MWLGQQPVSIEAEIEYLWKHQRTKEAYDILQENEKKKVLIEITDYARF